MNSVSYIWHKKIIRYYYIKRMIAREEQNTELQIKQVKSLTTALTKRKKQNVQIIMLVNMNMCVKLRSKMFSSCIGWNELIFGNFNMRWMVVKFKHKNVPIFVLIGVSHRFAWSTKVYVDREREMSALKKWNVSGILRQVLSEVECYHIYQSLRSGRIWHKVNF